jgi:transposase, IS30 family
LSPEQISESLALEFPFDKEMQVSHETIYLWLYKQKENNIDLYKLLRRNHKKRQKRKNKYNYRCKIEGKKSIHSRNEEANNRTEFGHWEGDLVESKGRDAYIVTLVERKTGYTLSSKLESKKSDLCVKAITEAFGETPNNMIKSITFDNGKEFSEFKTLEELLETEIYFADPYCSWQRGTNENTNGLLRQYLPKKKSFKSLTENSLKSIINRLNKRPRKRLGFVSPFEAVKKEFFAVQN